MSGSLPDVLPVGQQVWWTTRDCLGYGTGLGWVARDDGETVHVATGGVIRGVPRDTLHVGAPPGYRASREATGRAEDPSTWDTNGEHRMPPVVAES